MLGFRNWQGRVSEAIGLKELKYDRLSQTDGLDLKQQPRHGGSPSRRKLVLSLGGLVLLVLLLTALLRHSVSPRTDSSDELVPDYFHFLLAATGTGVEFCRTILSAAAVDFPTPRIIGWQEEKPAENSTTVMNPQLARIDSVLTYLNQVGHDLDEELILIADGHDVWFQLRLSVLLERYHAINERANRRIYNRLGSTVVKGHNITQRVIFSAQSSCWPENEDNIECYTAPQSEVPVTHSKAKGEDSTIYPPRYLSSATILGPVGVVREIFKAAAEKAKEESNGDRDVFARMFGEQEYQREVMRSHNLWWWHWIATFFAPDKHANIIAPHPTRERMSPWEGARYDYGIGLDYRGELSQPSNFSEQETQFIVYQPSQDGSQKGQQDKTPARKSAFPTEIENSTPPFWTADYTGLTKLPDQEWSQVPLYTNMGTGVIPVLVHSRAHRNGMQDRIKAKWDQMWFYPHFRPIINTKSNTWRMPAALIDGPNGPAEFWGTIDERGGFRIETGNPPGDWVFWGDACGSEQSAANVFGDGKGPYKNPMYYLSIDNSRAGPELEEWQEAFREGIIDIRG
jgi:hypothetical protein